MNLTLSKQPAAFSQIANSAFATGSVLTATLLENLAENIKFAAARNEEFYGFYVNGQTVILPVSPVDGYHYARNELSYLCCSYASDSVLTQAPGPPWGLGSAGSTDDGGPMPPTRWYAAGPGQLTRCSFTVNQSTGLVTTSMTYGGSAAADGAVLVITLARRLR